MFFQVGVQFHLKKRKFSGLLQNCLAVIVHDPESHELQREMLMPGVSQWRSGP